MQLVLRFETFPNKEFIFSMYKNIWEEWLRKNYDWDEKWQKNHFDDHFNFKHFYCIYYESVIIGYVQMIIYDTFIYLEKLEIIKEYQNKGFGQQIIKLLSGWLNPNTIIVLYVHDKNREAYSFYKAYGFEVVSKNYPYIYMKIN